MITLGVVPDATPQAPAPAPMGGVEAAVVRELTDAERLTTSAGQTAVQLAKSLDSIIETGSAKASLAKQLDATMATALAGVSDPDDPLTKARERRAARRGA